MAFSNRVDTVTNNYLVPDVVDTVLRGNVFATRMLGKAKKFRSSTMLFPIKYTKGVAGQSFAGFDTLPTSASDTRVNMTYTPRFYACNVALPLTELSANATEMRVLELATIEMRSRAQDMADDIGTILYLDGTGNDSKDFNGLASVVSDSVTIGGLSRSTYTTLQSTVTASGGTLTLAKMRTLWNAVSDPGQQPTMILVTKAIFGFYESLLQPQERIYKEATLLPKNLGGTTGFKTLEYIGTPVLADQKCTSGVMFFLNEDYLDFYGLPVFGAEPAKVASADISGNNYDAAPGLGFSWSGWVKPSNAASVNGFVYAGGDLITDNPRRHGKLTGITGV